MSSQLHPSIKALSIYLTLFAHPFKIHTSVWSLPRSTSFPTNVYRVLRSFLLLASRTKSHPLYSSLYSNCTNCNTNTLSRRYQTWEWMSASSIQVWIVAGGGRERERETCCHWTPSCGIPHQLLQPRNPCSSKNNHSQEFRGSFRPCPYILVLCNIIFRTN